MAPRWEDCPELSPDALWHRIRTSQEFKEGDDVDQLRVAALGLRLIHHARALDRLAQQQSLTRIIEWASSVYLRWARLLNVSNVGAMLSTARVDPLTISAGALCLPDQLHREDVFDAYHRYYVRLQRDGIQAVAAANKALLATLYANVDPDHTTVPTIFGDGWVASVGEPRSAEGLARESLILTAFGRHRLRDTSAMAIGQTAAVAFRTARERDFSGAGLILLASALRHERAEPKALEEWVCGWIRTDGLVGLWDLFPTKAISPGLLVTCNCYFGLQALHSPTSLVPGLKRAARVSTSRLDDVERPMPHRSEADVVVGRMLQWLSENLSHFTKVRNVSGDDDLGRSIKPLVELALVTQLLTTDAHYDKVPQIATWARGIALRLLETVEWEGLAEAFRVFPKGLLGLLVFPAIENALDRRIQFHDEVREILRDPFSLAQERTPMREMDFHYMCRLAGVDLKAPTIRSQAKRTLLGWSANPLRFGTDSLYDMTHVVFYATDFGRSDPKPLEFCRKRIQKVVGPLALGSMLYEDYDLGAEFLLTHLFMNLAPDPVFSECMRRLLDAVGSDGGVPGPPSVHEETDDPFEITYHTTLVGLLAVAESYVRELWGDRAVDDGAPDADYAAKVAARLLGDQSARVGSVRQRLTKELYVVEHRSGTSFLCRFDARSPHVGRARSIASANDRGVDLGSAATSGARSKVHRTCDAVWLLSPFVRGRQVKSALRSHAELGALLRRFHGARRPVGVETSRTDQWLACLDQIEQTKLERQCVNELRGSVETASVPLHGDPHPGNLVWTGRSATLVDFDECGWGLAELDLAIAVMYLDPAQEDFGDLVSALVEAYDAGTPRDWTLLRAACVLAPLYSFQRIVVAKDIAGGLRTRALRLARSQSRIIWRELARVSRKASND